MPSSIRPEGKFHRFNLINVNFYLTWIDCYSAAKFSTFPQMQQCAWYWARIFTDYLKQIWYWHNVSSTLYAISEKNALLDNRKLNIDTLPGYSGIRYLVQDLDRCIFPLSWNIMYRVCKSHWHCIDSRRSKSAKSSKPETFTSIWSLALVDW